MQKEGPRDFIIYKFEPDHIIINKVSCCETPYLYKKEQREA